MAVDPKILYLEADEEITSVVDKLRKTEFKKVVLVVPKEASLLQSVVNLKLLKRQAENLEKSISIVTADKVGRNLAEKVGIIASSKIDEKVRAMEPVLSDAKPAEEILEDGPLTETNEIVFKDSPTDDHKGSWQEVEEPEDIVLKEADETPVEVAEEILDEKTSEWSKTEVAENEKPEKRLFNFQFNKLYVIAGFLVFAFLFTGFIFLPRAKATILVTATKKQVSIDFKAEKDAKVDTEKNVIPAQLLDATGSASKKFTATGKKNIGTKATGNIRIANLSGTAISWIPGTRFYPDGNSSLIFRATGIVAVPDGQIVTVPVEADAPGDQYNGFGNNQKFLLSSGPSANISMSSKYGMSGGTNKEVTYVTQSDINSAKESVTAEAYETAEGDFVKKVGDLKLLENTKKKEINSQTASPGLNAEASEFTMTVKVSEKGLAYNLADVSNLVKADVNKEFGFAKQIINDGSTSVDVSIADSDLAAGAFSGTVKASPYVSAKLDLENIKSEIVGQNQAKAENYIKGLDDVTNVKTDFWPSFIRIFPRLKNHIYLTVEVANPEGGN